MSGYPVGRSNERKYQRTCAHCERAFNAAKPSAKYCSDRCRRRASDVRSRATCVDCGAQLCPGSGRPGRRVERCVPCWREVEHTRTIALGHRLEHMWAEGKSLKEIGEALGWAPTSDAAVLLTRYRKLGFDLPYRYDAQRRAAAETARWAA